MNWRTSLVAIILACTVGLGKCERSMTVTITNDSNPPTFKLDGSGRLFFFTVYEVVPGKPPSADGPVLWKIRPADEDQISLLPEIKYGVISPSFTQTVPHTGAPPPLLEGKLYSAGGPALEANGGGINFRIKDGRAVVVPEY